MSAVADALEVLLKHSGVPHESEDRDVVETAIEDLRKRQRKSTKPEDE